MFTDCKQFSAHTFNFIHAFGASIEWVFTVNYTHISLGSPRQLLSMVRLIRMCGRKLIWSRSLQLIHVPIQTKEFRGISATSVTARTFERTVHSTFSKQNFERYIRNDQFAYRMGGSCTNALLRIQHDIYQASLDDPKIEAVRVFRLDFSKALDSITHSLLSEKAKKGSSESVYN